MSEPEFPHGQLNPDDEGAIEMAMATDPRKQVIIIQFPKPVKWIALPLTDARSMRDLLDKHCKNLEALGE